MTSIGSTGIAASFAFVAGLGSAVRVTSQGWLGIVATTALLIVGQFTLGTAIDRFGWFGVEQVAVSTARVIGLVLLAAGAALTPKR